MYISPKKLLQRGHVSLNLDDPRAKASTATDIKNENENENENEE
jgi:hypothetical protein